MKNLVLAMALAAVSLTIVLVVIRITGDDGPPGKQGRDPGSPAPVLVPVLAGSGDGVEVLVRARYAQVERRRFTNRSLSEALGLDPGHYGYLEAIVVNGSGDEVVVDPRTLILEAEDGRGARGYDLNDLTRDAAPNGTVPPAAQSLLNVLAPARSRPLAPKATRRLLIAVPGDILVERVLEGRFLRLDLAPRHAGQRPLDSWLARRRPAARLLEAVLDTPGADGPGERR